MNITFTDINWRNADDSSIFNLHAINNIVLDMDKDIVTINCVAGSYSSPYYSLGLGGGVRHFEFTCMNPNEFGKYIDIAIFESNGKVCIANHCGTVPEFFKNKCKNFCC